ncbi:MAG TPA: TonB-dependent receptor [Myxococcales bacterium]|nr:TonB-dependent receptor [Myxococcales bacterium]
MHRAFACALLLPALSAAQEQRSQPLLIREVEPRYPPAALAAKLAGSVLLHLAIDAGGTVLSARVVRATPPGQGFEEAALEAARGMRFEGGPAEFDHEIRFEPPSGKKEMGEEIQVLGHYQNQVGTTDAASAGSYTRLLLEDRPILRPGEIEELVPGLIVTQHSGAGKANQFLLRGFNLDHGTDFATTIEGIPVNLPSHAHGQGYDDLNFVIPELIGHVDYLKGPYYAAKGDFASAGAADLYYVDDLQKGKLQVTGGSFGYYRAVAASAADLAGGRLLLGLEGAYEDGPWTHPEEFRKFNGVLRWTRPLGDGTLSLFAMGYAGGWNATDQIPQRAVADGLIGLFSAVDPSDGGSSSRFSLSGTFDGDIGGGELKASLYTVKYALDLFSNFTYFLVDPINGDQMEQTERRWTEGTSGSWTRAVQAFGIEQKWQLGWDARLDHVGPLGLYHTVSRERLFAWSVDDVKQASGALYAQVEAKPVSWLGVMLGLRGTLYDFDVTANDPRNSGSNTAGLLLPKATFTLGPWAKTELFLNYGEDYHSNDARGVFATVDARTGEAIPTVTPLPRSRGYEIGARTEVVPQLQTSLALWRLDLDSELVWDADEGTTAPSAPTRRQGIEWSTRYQPKRWLLLDLDVSLSRARFLDGSYVPEAIESAVAAGVSIHRLGAWSASLFLRYFGPRALTQDDSVRSTASTLFNAQVAYQVGPRLKFVLDAFNLLDVQVDDMAYYYQSRLRGEPAGGIGDIHFHPAEPRSLRATLVLEL